MVFDIRLELFAPLVIARKVHTLIHLFCPYEVPSNRLKFPAYYPVSLETRYTPDLSLRIHSFPCSHCIFFPFLTACHLHEIEGEPTRLCRCIVYSLATTSEIALLPPAFLDVFGAVEGLLLGIVSVVTLDVSDCDHRALLSGAWDRKS